MLTLTITLPLDVYEGIAALAEGEPVEVYAAELLAQAVAFGPPVGLEAIERLATQAADLAIAGTGRRGRRCGGEPRRCCG